MILSHDLRADGTPDAQSDPGSPLQLGIPGNPEHSAWLIRSRRGVLKLFRDETARNLALVSWSDATAGTTLQNDGGLLRRSGPDTWVRRVLNPLFTPAEAELLRPAISACARKRAGEITPGADLAATFVPDYIGDVATIIAGLEDGEWPVLADLSEGTTGTLIRHARDRGPAREKWEKLYDVCAVMDSRARFRHARGTIEAPCDRAVIDLEQAFLSPAEVTEVMGTLRNGIPTMVPAMKAATAMLLDDPGLMTTARGDKATAARVCMKTRAHFTFSLIGMASVDVAIDGQPISAGELVIPCIHAAELSDPGSSFVGFGAGAHACPGKPIAEITIEEGLAALAAIDSVALARPLKWLEGTMPVPAEVVVT